MKTARKTLIFTLSAAVVSILFSCATVEEQGEVSVNDVLKSIKGEPIVPRSANRIYCPPFINMTGNAGLEEIVSIKLKESINSDGRLVVVSDRKNSELLLQVAIKEYLIQNIEFNEIGQPVKKRMLVIAGMTLVDIVKKRVILSDPGIQAFQVFSDLVPPISSESQIMEMVSDNLAKRITAKTVSGWYTNYMTDVEKGKR